MLDGCVPVKKSCFSSSLKNKTKRTIFRTLVSCNLIQNPSGGSSVVTAIQQAKNTQSHPIQKSHPHPAKRRHPRFSPYTRHRTFLVQTFIKLQAANAKRAVHPIKTTHTCYGSTSTKSRGAANGEHISGTNAHHR